MFWSLSKPQDRCTPESHIFLSINFPHQFCMPNLDRQCIPKSSAHPKLRYYRVLYHGELCLSYALNLMQVKVAPLPLLYHSHSIKSFFVSTLWVGRTRHNSSRDEIYPCLRRPNVATRCYCIFPNLSKIWFLCKYQSAAPLFLSWKFWPRTFLLGTPWTHRGLQRLILLHRVSLLACKVY